MEGVGVCDSPKKKFVKKQKIPEKVVDNLGKIWLH